MIITRSPLRISLGGGGTDLPSYYREHSGFLIAAAIDKYVYITLHQTFVPELIIKYSKLERVLTVDEVEHPIIREALRMVGIEAPSLEITSMADIPAGTSLYRYFELDIERPSVPNVTAWYRRLQERPAYRRHVMLPFGELYGRLDP